MGNFLEYIKMAVQNILANKGRSFLTMLGIIIGISSVIMIMSVGDGVANSMTAEADSVGGGQITIMTSNEADVANEYMTPDDVEAIKSKVDGVEGATPYVGASGLTVTGKGEFDISIQAGTESLNRAASYVPKRGSFFNEADVQEGRRVCALTESDAKRLFGTDDVVGMDIDLTINGVVLPYTIKGVLGSKENSAFVQYTYEGMPVTLYVPFTSLADYGMEVEEFWYVYVFVDKTMDPKKISDSLIHLLESRHQSAGEDFYQIQSFQDMLETLNTMMSMVTAFISFVAAISLLVGGIGVMNIMLVSVTERTREIGIRKALGAKTASIMLQFLAESAIISAMGGIIGILLGLAGGFGICQIMSGSMGSVITPGVKLTTVLGATVFACAVGIFFGIYPARKAAKLSPIEALRRN